MPGVNLRRAPIESLEVDGLVFAVRWSRRRRTIGISVARERRAARARARRRLGAQARERRARQAPVGAPQARRVRRRSALPRRALRFVDGERLPYLGRTYRLVLVDAAEPPPSPCVMGASSWRAAWTARRAPPSCSWYTERARARIGARVAHYAPLVGATPAARRGPRPRHAPLGRLRRAHAHSSASTGSSCSSRPRSSTTSWCMSSPTCTSPTTGRDSGGAWPPSCPTGSGGAARSRGAGTVTRSERAPRHPCAAATPSG